MQWNGRKAKHVMLMQRLSKGCQKVAGCANCLLHSLLGGLSDRSVRNPAAAISTEVAQDPCNFKWWVLRSQVCCAGL